MPEQRPIETSEVCIGVHVHAEPESLRATLASLLANTPAGARLLLLPDGPDAPTAAALAALGALPQIGTVEPRGAAACFNRLARAAPGAAVIVLLESGALVGPGWLDGLLAALAADPRNGLAGPSTNSAWNEQAVYPGAAADAASVARSALDAARRFGAEARSLEPLHSLADFCYAVRREVVAAIGAADEGYGLGPCWELDYNTRAARAGFRGVWACGAYVHRLPPTARRQRDELRAFDGSRRRYQDRLCALRLLGTDAGYEPHCRGDTCEHFAPAGLIQIHLPLAPPPPPGAHEPPRPHTPTPHARTPAHPHAPTPPRLHTLTPSAIVISPDMVSCIMPTRDRPDFALQAVRYFQRQDYPHRELIIVDDGAPGLAELLPPDPRVRYARLEQPASIGAKRNHACSLARGGYIAQWDDDDWHAPDRLRHQLAPLAAGAADICALRADIFFDLERWSFWRCDDDLHRRMFIEDAHGGTLVFHRRVWDELATYPDLSLAEDARFLQRAQRRGARLTRLSGEGHFVYLRHGGNTWGFACGTHLRPDGWTRVATPPLPPDDLAFYAARSPAAPLAAAAPPAAPATPARRDDGPLVSCLMPTSGRRTFVPQAIRYFQRQDYANRELVILDDGPDPVADLVPPDPRIRYVHLDERLPLGAKRNLACRLARGELLAHWDDDDWMASWRLSYQVAALLGQGAELCGAERLLYYHLAEYTAWQYEPPLSARPWLAGNTLCYRRSLWARSPFPVLAVGEDTLFVWGSRAARAAVLADHRFYVGLIHPGNTSPKRLAGPAWRHHPPEPVRALIGGDLDAYGQ